MVHSVIEILVIKFFVISVKFTNTVMKTNHKIFVHHETFGLSDDFVGIFVTCLGVERTKDYTSFWIIFEQRIFVCLHTAFSKFCVQIIWSSTCKFNQLTIMLCLIFEFLKFFEFVLLNNICKLFSNELQLLFVKNINILWIDSFLFIIVKPDMTEHLFCRSSLVGCFLQHHFH